MSVDKLWIEKVEKLIEKYDVDEVSVSFTIEVENDAKPEEKTRSNTKDRAKTPPLARRENDDCQSTSEMVGDAVLEAFDDLDDTRLTVDDLVSEVFAKYGDDNLDVKRSTVRAYVYRRLKKLRESNKVEKIGRGEYMKLAEYDLSQRPRQTREMQKGTIGDVEQVDE